MPLPYQKSESPAKVDKPSIGRPRTTTPPVDQVIELGKELVEWAKSAKTKKEKLERCRYADWYSLEKGMLRKDWEALTQKPEFLVYYEQTRNVLAKNYIDGTINPSIAHRFMRHYCPEVKEEENVIGS